MKRSGMPNKIENGGKEEEHHLPRVSQVRAVGDKRESFSYESHIYIYI